MSSKFDWEAIEREYRAGQLSIREISRQYGPSEGAIRQRAKKYEWQRDLSGQVQEAAKSHLVRGEVRSDHAQGEESGEEIDREAVELAAARAVEVVRGHRQDISQARQLAQSLMSQLMEAGADRKNLEEVAMQAATKEDGTVDQRYLNKLMSAVSIPSHTGALRDLSQTLKNLIPLERQAFNMDSGEKDGGGVSFNLNLTGED